MTKQPKVITGGDGQRYRVNRVTKEQSIRQFGSSKNVMTKLKLENNGPLNDAKITLDGDIDIEVGEEIILKATKTGDDDED